MASAKEKILEGGPPATGEEARLKIGIFRK
jgi:hypothetical protein